MVSCRNNNDIGSSTHVLTSDDIIDTLEEIVSSGLALTAVLSRRFSLTDSSGLALFALRAINSAGRRGLSQTDLARTLNRSAPSTTRLVDHLEKAGLVVRSAHPSDRRINMVHLSETGKSQLDEILTKAIAFGMELFAEETEISMKDFRSKLSRVTTIANGI